MILLESLELKKTERRPVWIMRQAGRYLSSYQKMRESYSFHQMSENAELATEVSLLPLRQYDFDAAIVFSDILIPLRALGLKVEFTEAGPQVAAPKDREELAQLKRRFVAEEDTPVILETLKQLRSEVSKDKAVLGFAGAPFTMLCYLLEGRLTKDLSITKQWLAKEPDLCHEWLSFFAQSMGEYCDAQVQAGANAVQLFDTWAGMLSPSDYERFALPYAREALSAVTAPTIYYVNGVAGILSEAAAVGAQALSVDWRMNLGQARSSLSHVIAIQGNLDPYALFLPRSVLRERVFEMCSSYGTSPGHIVNLGHGIVPTAPESGVHAFLEAVWEWSASLK